MLKKRAYSSVENVTPVLLVALAEMEKAYKIAHAKLWVWKISTQNMCKKCPQLCKICKNSQNCEEKKKL